MLTIVDYNAGNLRSVKRACDAVGISATITQDPDAVRNAERIIFPGVGAAPSAMETLKKNGLDQALKDAFTAGTPILGICLGTQIILENSEEGNVKTLGLVPGATIRFPASTEYKVPHIGWNGVRPTQSHPLLHGLESGDAFYFVHSYYPNPSNPENIFAVADHGIEFCCAIGHKNLFGTQFHPEKSGRFGLNILSRFAQWNGSL